MADIEPVAVLLNGKVAGTLHTDRVAHAEFAYADRYLDDRSAVPLSMSLPFQEEPFRSTATSRWVEGLLPDNQDVLRRWCSNVGVSPPTPLGLISTRVGHDCAGAVQFCRAGDEETLLGRPGQVSLLARGELVREVALMAQDTARWLPDDEDAYFSLGGYHAKTTLHQKGGEWGRPSGNIPTTHILKPSPVGLPGQAVVEHLCLATAQRLGLSAADSEIAVYGDHPAAVITRFDRTHSRGEWTRIHQEDMCQTLGYPPAQKYEKGGGPGIAAIGDAIQRYSTYPEADLRKFRDAVLYSWIIVNRDGHARNYSMLIQPGRVRLAPLYDINSALPFAHKRIGTLQLAMRLGADFTVDRAGANDSLLNLSAWLTLPVSETLERAEELASTIIEAAAAQINSLPSALPGAEAVDAFQSRIDKRAADCLRTVAATKKRIAH
ncbi:MAG: HipA domain-containing protein [Acidimicrobiia bacterium]|nr:HipA domain-containing protein [Acidimicrobiia bacterium]